MPITVSKRCPSIFLSQKTPLCACLCEGLQQCFFIHLHIRFLKMPLYMQVYLGLKSHVCVCVCAHARANIRVFNDTSLYIPVLQSPNCPSVCVYITVFQVPFLCTYIGASKDAHLCMAITKNVTAISESIHILCIIHVHS